MSTTMANGDGGDVADNLMSSLKSFLTEKVTEIENNIKNTIVSELNAGVPSPVNQDSPDGQTKTWSSVVSQPRNLKSMMRDTRNDEKIKENEKREKIEEYNNSWRS